MTAKAYGGCVLLAALLPAAGEAKDLAIGYVSHFPMVVHDDDSLAGTGANVVEVRAPWALIEPRDGEFDFTRLDQQLEWAERNDLQLVFIMEAGPAHAAGVPWLIERLQARGETMVDLAGNVQRDPSLFSPTYKQYLARYLQRVTEHLATHPLSRRVYGYNNGCEWWYPLANAYSPLALAAFRESLRARYGPLEALNAQWGTRFASWEEVTAPRLATFGGPELPQGWIIPAAYTVDACYCTTAESHVAVEPGRAITLEADYAASGMRAGAVSVEIAWLGDEGPQPLTIDRATEAVGGSSREGTVKVSGAAPEGGRLDAAEAGHCAPDGRALRRGRPALRLRPARPRLVGPRDSRRRRARDRRSRLVGADPGRARPLTLPAAARASRITLSLAAPPSSRTRTTQAPNRLRTRPPEPQWPTPQPHRSAGRPGSSRPSTGRSTSPRPPR